MSETFPEWHLNTEEIQTWAPQVDNFSKELSDFLSDDKFTNKEQISNILKSNSDFKNGFEEFLKTANNRLKLKCKKELQNCSTEEEIKSIILENLPEWYKVWNVDVIEDGEIRGDGGVDGKNSFIDITEQADQKEEQADQKEEQADQKEEQADQKEEQADQKEEQADQKEWQKEISENLDESIKRMKEAIESRDKLKIKYIEIDERTNENSKNYQNMKSQLENSWVINQLRKSNHDDEFIKNYVLIHATLHELKTNPTNYEQSDISYFDKVVKNLNNACKIPDTNFDSFSGENISQTRTELFNSDIWNESLIKAKESNRSSHDYSEVFQEMWFEEVLAKYGRFLQWDLKEFYNQYQNNPEIRDKINWMRNNRNPKDEDIKLYNKYNEMYW